MELIKLTHDNIDREHICCAISSNKDVQVMSKKAWLKERLDEGLVFLKGDVRGKCFIEYIPAESAWAPIEAEGYMYINCLWVSGQFKGHGYSNLLLDACIDDSKGKGKKGVAILSAKKKLGFLSDPEYMRHKGFVTVDTAEPYFELLYLPFEEGAEQPRLPARNCFGENGFPYRKFLFLNFNDMRKDTMTKNNENQNCRYMTRRIGSTTYKVKVVFSDNGGETMEEKILRMIRNEGLQNGGERGTMDAPQMSRQSERSAS